MTAHGVGCALHATMPSAYQDELINVKWSWGKSVLADLLHCTAWILPRIFLVTYSARQTHFPSERVVKWLQQGFKGVTCTAG